MKGESLLTDRHFKDGFKVRGMGLPIYGDEIETFGGKFDTGIVFQYEKQNKNEPQWSVSQWASRFPFHDIKNESGKGNYKFCELSPGVYRYENTSKILEADTNTGQLTMGLSASKCYKYPRVKGQEWPHFLIERGIGDLKNPQSINKISDSNKINVNIDIRLNSYKDCMGSSADFEIHAIIFIYYLFIANYSPQKKAFDDMLWFGLPLWDNRWAVTPLQSFPDKGTKASASEKWIYNNSTNRFFTAENNLYTPDGKMIFGQWKSVHCDVLPLIREGIKEAQSNGYMMGSKWENLYINGMYFGFESCGTYDAEISVKNIDIIKECNTL